MLLCRICASRKLDMEVEPGLKPRYSKMGCRHLRWPFNYWVKCLALKPNSYLVSTVDLNKIRGNGTLASNTQQPTLIIICVLSVGVKPFSEFRLWENNSLIGGGDDGIEDCLVVPSAWPWTCFWDKEKVKFVETSKMRKGKVYSGGITKDID